jgi:hypothetical protein
VPDEIGAGRLLMIVAAAPAVDVESALLAHIRAADLRPLHRATSARGAVFIAYTDAAPSGVRDWLAESLGADASAFIVEFERWSALGDDADRAWLLRRGH